MEPQQVVSKTVDYPMHKQLVEMVRQCWRNTQYSSQECIEIVEIPDITQEENIWQHVSYATGVNIYSGSLEYCHFLLSEGNNGIIGKFSIKKYIESALRN